MNTFYDVLNLDMNASKSDIKRQYVKLLKKHPPEKDPDGFKKIRNAYEVLNEEKSRKEYDASLKYKNEISEYLLKGEQALENKNYFEAIKYYKKILVLEPSLGFARNLLGLAYLYNEENHKARNCFDRVVNENTLNPTYLYNLAVTYYLEKDFKTAKKYYLKAYELDKTNSNIVLDLVDIYIEEEFYKSAINLLEESIELDGVIDFQDFIYFFKLIEIYVIQNKTQHLKNTLDKIYGTIPDDEEIYDYVIWKFVNLTDYLIDVGRFSTARILINWSNKIKKSEVMEHLLNKVDIWEDYAQFNSDNEITNGIKRLVALWLSTDLSEKERTDYFDDIMLEISREYKSDVEKSIHKTKMYYTNLYKLNKEMFDYLDQELNKSSYSNATSSSCFVATVIYKDPLSLELFILRNWRDKTLKNNLLGKLFVNLYYFIGPYLARGIGQSKILEDRTKKVIDFLISRIYPDFKKYISKK